MDAKERLHYILNQTEYVTMFMAIHDEEVKAKKVREFLERGQTSMNKHTQTYVKKLPLWNDQDLFVVAITAFVIGILIGKFL